jgi:ribose/xylose/arabinose/galactoside ABC-type transport system permease subunit
MAAAPCASCSGRSGSSRAATASRFTNDPKTRLAAQAIGARAVRIAGMTRPIRPHLDAGAVLALACWLRRERIEVAHTHTSKAGFVGRLAARLAGVPVNRVKRWVYAISGLCAGIAGLVVVSINSSSDANLVGLGMELDAIAAVAVGGTPFTGGQASVVGSLIGALLIQLVRYTLLANGVPDAAALVVKGLIIAGAVWSQQRGKTT